MLRNIKSFNAPEIEEKVLQLWKEKHIFEKTLIPKKGKKSTIFHFWEGPPYANGRPGIHHIVSRVMKDIVLRFQTMRGFVVPRKAGWDTHGLPIEIAAEKELGVSTKKEIEAIGVEEFNKAAKKSIFKYQDEWEKLTDRIGYWLDLKNAYKTYTPDFVESLWWVFAQINKRGYLKESYKVMPYCPRCQTVLSSHELGQPGVYQSVNDPSVYLKFPLKDRKNEYLLVWTTTPWTLSANVAVAVGRGIGYLRLEVEISDVDEFKKKEVYYIANNVEVHSNIFGSTLGYGPLPDNDIKKASVNFRGKGNVIFEVQAINAEEMVGWQYHPLFSYPQEIQLPITPYSVLAADFVSTEDGTGLVHIAPSFGEDDFNLIFADGFQEGSVLPETVEENGTVSSGIIGEGMWVKDADGIILNDLRARGLVLFSHKEKHEYPHCWRCSTPLLYSARQSWFFEVSRLRKQMVQANKTVNWVPDYLKEGRFGEWIANARDWAISRERFWGTPLPIWRCDDCHATQVADSLAYLNNHQTKKPNTFHLMRHGEADANVGNWIASKETKGFKISKLTDKGIADVEKTAKKLKREKIDVIIHSPLHRTTQTAQIVGKALGVPIKMDKRLVELNVGEFNGKDVDAYHAFFENPIQRFEIAPKGAETLAQVRERMYKALRDIDDQYEGKNILIIGHGDCLWMAESALHHIPFADTFAMKYLKPSHYITTHLDNYPTDEYGNVDIHRPYVDDVVLRCDECGGEAHRVEGVADVWFDSGAMPYGSTHYPFGTNPKHQAPSTKSKKDQKIPNGFPADFIAEGIDQTRGWFYTLMAVAVLLGHRAPYKNVVSLGLVLDKNGQKMSKSKGNVVDPWSLIHKTGVDAVRWYFYGVNSPAEPKNFDEQEVIKTLRRFILIVYNSYAFLSLYGSKGVSLKRAPSSNDALDEWIMMRLHQTIQTTTASMNAYDTLKYAHAIETFSDDLSRWYIRRSRRRFQKPANKTELKEVSAVLAYVLREYAKLLAPSVPFFAEALYQSIAEYASFPAKESVHLEEWPIADKKKTQSGIGAAMEAVRQAASIALAKRAEAGIKVRQPLQTLTLNSSMTALKPSHKELLEILKDEVNVKEIAFDAKQEEACVLDTTITPELKTEGYVRELVRYIQGMRQDGGLVPTDTIAVWVRGSEEMQALVNTYSKEIAAQVGAKTIGVEQSHTTQVEIEAKVGTHTIHIGITKL